MYRRGAGEPRGLEEGPQGAWGAGRRRGPTLISGAALNCGGPFSRLPAALASLKLGVGELGGFTGSGTRRLGPPALFPEPGATLPAPAGAVALGSFLQRGADRRRLRGGSQVGRTGRLSGREGHRGSATVGPAGGGAVSPGQGRYLGMQILRRPPLQWLVQEGVGTPTQSLGRHLGSAHVRHGRGAHTRGVLLEGEPRGGGGLP